MTARSAAGAHTLPREYYTSSSIFQQEVERIFLKRWLYAGRASQAPDPGSYFLFEVDTESVIVLRDGEGRLRAFHNTCRHRGTRLCAEARGAFSKSVQCCYHAWTYGLDGRLIGAPNMDEVEGFDKADYPLLPVALAEWEGGLFVNLDPDPEPFEHAFAPLIGKFDQWNLPALRVAHEIVYDVAANWKLVVQNYSECYHCPSLHPQLNRLTPYRDSYNDLEEGPVLGGPMRLAQDGGSMTMSGRRCAVPLGQVAGDDLNLIYYYTVFPNLLLSLHPDYVLVHEIRPEAPDRTRIVCQWLFHPDAMAQPGFDPGDAVEFWNTTNAQDWEVSEMSQRGIASRAYRPGPYAALESMIATWDRQYLAILGHQST
jgi:Rieske 2Fe-2S family protein